MGTPFTKILASSALAVLLTACASDGSNTGEDENSKNLEQQQATADAVGGNLTAPEYDDALLSQTTVYFDFDRDTIKPQDKEVLMAHAAFLAANPSAKAVLEGHCDERGTVEYNLALGERRAKAVRRFLLVNGANPNQVDTVSFGEEQPVQLGSNEAAWAQNRRAEIKYQAL